LLENLDVSYSIKKHHEEQQPDGLKALLGSLYKIRTQIRKLDISGNLGINAPGTLDALWKYLSS